MMSVTAQKCYDIKEKFFGQVTTIFNPESFVLGNNELVVDNTMRFSVSMGRGYLYFATGNDRVKDFIKKEEDEGEFR